MKSTPSIEGIYILPLFTIFKMNEKKQYLRIKRECDKSILKTLKWGMIVMWVVVISLITMSFFISKYRDKTEIIKCRNCNNR